MPSKIHVRSFSPLSEEPGTKLNPPVVETPGTTRTHPFSRYGNQLVDPRRIFVDLRRTLFRRVVSECPLGRAGVETPLSYLSVSKVYVSFWITVSVVRFRSSVARLTPPPLTRVPVGWCSGVKTLETCV